VKKLSREDLKLDDLVTVKSGKVYRIDDLRDRGDCGDTKPVVGGFLQRDGDDFGPFRLLLIENLTKRWSGNMKPYYGLDKIGIDWALLRQQKLTLVTLAITPPVSVKDADYPLEIGAMVEDLSGIINLLDAIQDEAVENGTATEEEVFGPRDADGYTK
jgi:hypothetical protein